MAVAVETPQSGIGTFCRAASNPGEPLHPGDILPLGEGLLDDRGRVAQGGEAGRAVEGEIG